MTERNRQVVHLDDETHALVKDHCDRNNVKAVNWVSGLILEEIEKINKRERRDHVFQKPQKTTSDLR